jgi:hypothetical protein
MKMRSLLTIILLVSAATAAEARSGTPEQQAACRPDVRRFCYRLPPDAADAVFFSCLQAHRPRLARKCRAALERNRN